MAVQLLLGGLKKHGLQHGNPVCPPFGRHPGELPAFPGLDGSHTEIDGNTALRLVEDDPEPPLHLVLLHHVELAVAAEGKYAVDTSIDDEIYLAAHFLFIDALVFVDYRDYGGNDSPDEINIHPAQSFHVVMVALFF
ncbi:hypothetical protein SDC9_125403 [bioreactor metagenome]|uniref:Uncharacterized protein n=1 Tax=bioreactor metagenome TaxID=1076179 RepID=A0A645CNP2_9ZZZZ